jgi:hypothetical protein
LKTGLMEVGNLQSGEIGIGYAQQRQLAAAGFQRGWEKAFLSPDGAVVDGYVFEFRAASGPAAMVTLFRRSVDKSYKSFAVADVPGATAYSGTSPEGREVVATAFARGRFLAGFTLGGPPRGHDYRSLLQSLAQQQEAALS